MLLGLPLFNALPGAVACMQELLKIYKKRRQHAWCCCCCVNKKTPHNTCKQLEVPLGYPIHSKHINVKYNGLNPRLQKHMNHSVNNYSCNTSTQKCTHAQPPQTFQHIYMVTMTNKFQERLTKASAMESRNAFIISQSSNTSSVSG